MSLAGGAAAGAADCALENGAFFQNGSDGRVKPFWKKPAFSQPKQASSGSVDSRHLASVGDVKVGMSAEQLAINEASGNALAEANLQTQPQWVQDLVHGDQAFADKARPLVDLGIAAWAGSAGASEEGATGSVLKGAIPDEIPRNLSGQMAMDSAKAGNGEQIMIGTPMADAPRLEALYGPGAWVKMQVVSKSTYFKADTATVHYFLNRTTGKAVEFKFK